MKTNPTNEGSNTSKKDKSKVLKFLIPIIVIIGVASPLSVFSIQNKKSEVKENAGKAFQNGFALYKEGKFAEALSEFQKAKRDGVISPNLYTNLGNIYYRLNQFGSSIANYERAWFLDKDSSSAINNLQFVRERLGLPPSEILSFQQGLKSNSYFLISSTAVSIGLFGLFAGLLLITIRNLPAHYRKRGFVVTTASVIVISISSVVCYFSFHKVNEFYSRAIILSENSVIRSLPTDNNPAIARAPIGTHVTMLLERGAWNYIRNSDGKQGWIPASEVEKVISPNAG